MRSRSSQSGVALFTAIFLIVVIAAVAAAFALTTTTQQRSSARALDAESAYAVATGELEIAIRDTLQTEACSEDDRTVRGYEIAVRCPGGGVDVQEGGESYTVHRIEVRAARGDRLSGSLVRRTVRAQVVSGLDG